MNVGRLKIVFIGSGKVATALSLNLKKNHTILQVYSKTLAHAKKLGKSLGCDYVNDLNSLSKNADLYIIAVKDDILRGACRRLQLDEKIVFHTSGATSIDILNDVTDHRGVIWPMYSFISTADLPSNIPFSMEASDDYTNRVLKRIVEDLRGVPVSMNSRQRAMAHLIAVFVNNFPNHIMAIAEELCHEAAIPFDLFLPLAKETINNIDQQSPLLNQTGPAIRRDRKTIKRHLTLLTPYRRYGDIYKKLTDSIIQSSRGRKKL